MNKFTKWGWFQIACFGIIIMVFGVCLSLAINQWVGILFIISILWTFEYGYSRGRHPERHYNEDGMKDMLKSEKEIKDLQEDMKHF